MIEFGAIETPTGYRLRFPNFQIAKDIQDRLTKEMLEAYWVIVAEVGSVHDWNVR